jgi:hypothetical protein
MENYNIDNQQFLLPITFYDFLRDCKRYGINLEFKEANDD